MADPRARFVLSAEDRTARAFGKVRRSMHGLHKVAMGMTKALAGGLALIGAALGLHQMKQANDRLERIGRDALRLKISPEFLSGWEYVAEQSQAAPDSIAKAIQKMTRRISSATRGKGEAAPILELLGLDAKSLSKLNPEQQFMKIMDRLSRMKTTGGRNEALQAIFDDEFVRDGAKMLDNGMAGIARTMAEAQALGLIVTEQMGQNAIKTSEALGRIAASFRAVFQSFVSEFGPTLESTGQWLVENMPAIKSGFESIAGTVKGIASDIKAVVGPAKEVLDLFSGVWDRREKAQRPQAGQSMLDSLTPHSSIARVVAAGTRNLDFLNKFNPSARLAQGVMDTYQEVSDPANKDIIDLLKKMLGALTSDRTAVAG